MKKVFVHRYRWSHDKKRRKYRKLLKEQKVRIIQTTKEGWLYEYQEGA